MPDDGNSSGHSGDQGGGQPAAYLVGQDGKFAENWLQNPVIPQDLREDRTLAAVTDFPSALKMLVNAQRMIGKDKVVVPKEGAPKAEWDAFYKAVGWPDSPDKYAAPARDPNAPPGLVWNPERFKAFASHMHGHHMTQRQITAAAEYLNQEAIADYQDGQTKQEQVAKDALLANRKAWGTQYQAKLQLADQAAAAFIDPSDLEYVTNKGFLTDPVIQRIFAAIGDAITPDRMRGTTGSVQSGESIQTQIDAIMGDTKGPYFTATHPQHAATVDRVRKLFEELHKPAA